MKTRCAKCKAEFYIDADKTGNDSYICTNYSNFKVPVTATDNVYKASRVFTGS